MSLISDYFPLGSPASKTVLSDCGVVSGYPEKDARVAASIARVCFSEPQPMASSSPTVERPLYLEKLKKDGRFTVELIQKYLDEYFTSYKEEIKNNDPFVFIPLASLLRRIVNVNKAIEKLLPCLDVDDVQSTHKLLPETILSVVQNKIDLDHCLQNIQLANLKHAHNVGDRAQTEKALREIYQSLHRMATIPLKNIESIFPEERHYGDASQLKLFFRAFYVYPLSFDEAGEQWAVIDMRKVPVPQRENALKFFTKAQMEKDLDFRSDHVRNSGRKRAPGSVLSYDLVDGRPVKKEGVNAKNGMIQLFYESRKRTADSHSDRQVGGRTRLSTVLTKKEEELLGLAKGDVYRETKSSEGFRSNWTPDRERTAAVDRLEFICTVRLTLKKILEKGIEAISSRELLNLSVYLKSIEIADLAALKGGYLTDPVFKQAVLHLGQIEQRLQNALAARDSVKIRQIGSKKGTKSAPSHGLLAVKEIFDMVGNWKKNLDEFIGLIEKVDLKEKSELSWFVKQFSTISGVLEIFLNVPLGSSSDSTEQLSCYVKHVQSQINVLVSSALELSLISENKELLKIFKDCVDKLNDSAITALVDGVLGPSFQIFTRIKDCLGVVHANCSDMNIETIIEQAVTSSLHTVNKVETLRAQEAQKLQTSGRIQTLLRFFPRYKISLRERVKQLWRSFIRFFQS